VAQVGGRTHHFCSRDCMQAFEAAQTPQRAVGTAGRTRR
jgi:YHS domain-containing protein